MFKFAELFCLLSFLCWTRQVRSCNPANQVPPKCGNTAPQTLIPGSEFRISSPWNPQSSPANSYPPNSNCKWMFDYFPGCQPYLECDYFDVANSPDCVEDFVRVMDGPQRVLRLCGRSEANSPFLLDASGTDFFDLEFVSNNIIETVGFQCRLTCKRPTPPTTTTVTPPIPKMTTLKLATGIPPKPSTSLCECGRSDLGRIIGGTNALPSVHIWQVALKYDNNFLCGGSVIGPRHILTASHCTRGRDASRFQVLLGRYNLTATTEPGAQARAVISIINNPKTDSSTLDYDFSILVLASTVNLAAGGNIGAVCLPKDDSDSYADQDVIVTGWGTRNASYIDLPSILNQAELRTNPRNTCGKYEKGEIKESMLCAGAENKDACQGDSGGPLVLLRNGTYYLVGVTSWGIGCATSGFPGVFARVSKILDWIKSSTDGRICAN